MARKRTTEKLYSSRGELHEQGNVEEFRELFLQSFFRQHPGAWEGLRGIAAAGGEGSELSAWMTQWQLPEGVGRWIPFELQDTLEGIVDDPALYADGYQWSGGSGFVVRGPVIRFEMEAPDLTYESWQGFCKRAHERLKALLDAEEARLEKPGFKRRKQKEPAHFDWLVMRLDGWTNTAIAKAVGRGQTSVSDAVTECARMIGIELPKPNHHGKPRPKSTH